MRKRNQYFILSGAGLVLGLVTGCTSLDDLGSAMPATGSLSAGIRGGSITVGEPFLIAMSDRPMQHGEYSFPQVRRFPDGEVMVAWSTQGDVIGTRFLSLNTQGSSVGGIDVPSPAVSTDGFITWSNRLPTMLGSVHGERPLVFRRNSSYAAEYFDGWTELDGGRVHAFSRNIWRVKSHVDDTNYHGVSAGIVMDNKGRVSEPIDVLFSMPDRDRTASEVARISPRGITLTNGSIALIMYSGQIFPYKLEPGRGYVTMLYESSDGGRSFSLRSIIAGPKDAKWGGEGPCEPSVVRLTNGDLFAVMRTGTLGGFARIKDSQPMLGARSTDDGVTWDTFRLPIKGVHPVLVQMSNGVLAMAYGRPQNWLRFSTDQGQSWGRPIAMSPSGQPTSGCTDLIEIEPGKLLYVYDLREYEPAGEDLWDPSQGYNAVLGRFVVVTRED